MNVFPPQPGGRKPGVAPAARPATCGHLSDEALAQMEF